MKKSKHDGKLETPWSKVLPVGTIVYVQYDCNTQWVIQEPVRVNAKPEELTPDNDPCNKSGIGNG